MNKGCFWGRLSRDPDDLVSVGEFVRGRISVAVQRHKKNADGTYSADFIPVTTWGKVAENCKKYLTKGRPVAVEYHLQSSTYEDKEGKKHFSLDVVADNIDFLPAKNDNVQPSQAQPDSTAQAQARAAAEQQTGDGFTQVQPDDLPF